MNYQIRAFQISLLLHSVIVALVIIGSAFMGQYKKTMVLDFDLRTTVSDVKKVEQSAPTPFVKTNSLNPSVHQSKKEKEPHSVPAEVPRISPPPEIPPVVKLPEARNLESRPMGLEMPSQTKTVKESSSGIAGEAKEVSGTNAGIGIADRGKESASTKYLNDHFAYIRDKILRNVSYPDSARRMGWQGKVLLSFIIMANGAVREFKIIKSSGFAMLDKNAIETVKDTAPFPKPPVEAQLVIPIVYRLE